MNAPILNPASSQYMGVIDQTSSKYAVPPEILASVIQQESSFNPNVATGAAGDTGIAQLTPPIYRLYNVDPHNPAQSIDAAGHYLADLKAKWGTWALAVKHYNGSGPQADAYSTQVMGRAAALGYNGDGLQGQASSAMSTLMNSILSILPGGGALLGAGQSATVTDWFVKVWNWIKPYLLRIFLVLAGAGIIIVSGFSLVRDNKGVTA